MKDETDEQVFKRMQSVNGKKGGNTTKERHGSAYYSRIGKEGAKRKQQK